VLPPVLTIVIFVWIGSTVQRYILEPVNIGARQVLARAMADIQDELPSAEPVAGKKDVFRSGDRLYKRLPSEELVPLYVYERVRRYDGAKDVPETGQRLYARYVELRYLQPYITVPLTAIVFFVVMYLLGRFIAAGIGRVFWNIFERGISRLPLVRNVYSSVKQVTDFMFIESEIEYTRVVAVEYPRRGIWSIGLVTGESMLDIRAAINEPVLSVLIPSSPMPVTGYTVTVAKSETIDLNITIDQAFQFCVSCGVVVPPHQMSDPFRSPLPLPGSNPAGLGETGKTSSETKAAAAVKLPHVPTSAD